MHESVLSKRLCTRRDAWTMRALMIAAMALIAAPGWGCGTNRSNSAADRTAGGSTAPAQNPTVLKTQAASPPAQPDIAEAIAREDAVQKPQAASPPAQTKIAEAIPREDYDRSRASAGMNPAQQVDPERISAFEQALAGSIAARRADAQRGDLLDEELVTYLSRTTVARIEGENGQRVLDAIREGNLAFDEEAGGMPDLEVNGVYPEGAPLSSVPPSLLKVYPALPDGIEYRFVGCRLILFERDARLILDYTENCLV